MQGTGGIRKLRWKREGSGESGGVRVIYYFHSEQYPLFLPTLFGKSKKTNISKAERNMLAKLTEELLATYGNRKERGGCKMSSAFESIQQGLRESIDFAKGKPIKAVVHEVAPPDAKAVRQHIGMTQAEFASAFGISLGTLRHWEQGDRTPQGPARVLLNVVAKEPKAVLRALSGGRKTAGI
ncbi:MAG: type II toxin-antitoxin system RelE/ParE family toxin [Desulfobulbaceae bacterium]|nr:type II toxin-antitoxin system RelE/ParE family toxin [Desulfobulbaceae bacterium]